MDKYIGPGTTLRIATGTARSAGDVVVENECVGVVQEDATTTEVPVMAIEGVYRLAKATGAINAGDLVDWDTSAGNVGKGITPASGDVTNFGIAMETVASGGTLINVKLIPGGGTFA